MQTGIIVQARLSSRRLPGKVLLPLAGKPLIDHLITRLQQAPDLPPWLIATSDDPSDDALADYCQRQHYPCFRGSLDQVASRMLAAAGSQNWTRWVRISGDSPLMDPALIRQALSLEAELVTNVQPRSFPVGQSVEVLTSDLLSRWLPEFGPDQQEHVTLGLYARQQHFKLLNFSAPQDYSQVRLVVDTPDDFRRIESLITQLGDQAGRADYQSLCRLSP